MSFLAARFPFRLPSLARGYGAGSDSRSWAILSASKYGQRATGLANSRDLSFSAHFLDTSHTFVQPDSDANSSPAADFAFVFE